MINRLLLFIAICVVGEVVVNLTWFRYLKKNFVTGNPVKEMTSMPIGDSVLKLFAMNISTFKGILERTIMAICLAIGLTSILIVFGALKIGTRLKSPDNKIQNDYFLIGNLTSIFISVIYVYIFEKSVQRLHT